jgi:hypothetical protein
VPQGVTIMAEHPKPADSIPHVADAQERERIAHEERKRSAAVTLEGLKKRFGVEEA